MVGAAELSPQCIERIARRVAELLAHGADDEGCEAHALGARTARQAEPRLLDAAGLAAKLGLTRTWVYEHAGELGAIQIGDGPRPRLRFDVSVAEQALAERRRTGAPSAANAAPQIRPRSRRKRARPTRVDLLPIGPPSKRAIMSRMRVRRRRWW